MISSTHRIYKQFSRLCARLGLEEKIWREKDGRTDDVRRAAHICRDDLPKTINKITKTNKLRSKINHTKATSKCWDGTGKICNDQILCNSPKVNRLIDQSATSVGWHWHWEIWKSSRRKLTLTLRSLPWLRSTGALRLVGHPQTLGVLLAVACFFKQRGPGRKLSFGYFNSTIFNSLVLLGSFPKFWRAQETNTTAPKSGKSDYCRALSAINRE